MCKCKNTETIQGGEFEYVLSKHLDDTCGAFDEIVAAHKADMRWLKSRIAELEAQVPKVAVPAKGVCPVCGSFGVNKPYCGECGAKLDWEEK